MNNGVFSNYVIDPNKFRFRKVVRILSLVILFAQKLLRQFRRRPSLLPYDSLPEQLKFNNDVYVVTNGSNKFPFNSREGLVIHITEEVVMMALNYFFLKATSEVKQFVDPNTYDKICQEKNGVLLYTSRILPI